MQTAEICRSAAQWQPSELSIDLSYTMENARRRSAEGKFTVVSTFSGGGGSSLGYRLAGGKVMAANEFVPEAARTYRTNFPETHVDVRDIRTLLHHPNAVEDFLAKAGTAAGELDLLDGSPPCCQFSNAGGGISDQNVMRSYSDVRQNHIATLPHDWAEFALRADAKTIVMENVPEIMTTGAEILACVMRRLRSRYAVQVSVLTARDFGVPQHRRRAFLVGIRHDIATRLGVTGDGDMQHVFPKPSTPVPVSIRQALDGLNQNLDDVLPFVKSARMSGLADLMARLPKEPNKHTRLRHVSPGETKHFSLIRTSWDLPAPTLTASAQMPNGLAGVFHPYFDRKFTLPELKRLASLPDDFVLTGTLSQGAERICRMVPPFLAAAVSDSIYRNVLKPAEIVK